MEPIGLSSLQKLQSLMREENPATLSFVVDLATKVLHEAKEGKLSQKELLELDSLIGRISKTYNAPPIVQSLYEVIVSKKSQVETIQTEEDLLQIVDLYRNLQEVDMNTWSRLEEKLILEALFILSPKEAEIHARPKSSEKQDLLFILDRARNALTLTVIQGVVGEKLGTRQNALCSTIRNLPEGPIKTEIILLAVNFTIVATISTKDHVSNLLHLFSDLCTLIPSDRAQKERVITEITKTLFSMLEEGNLAKSDSITDEILKILLEKVPNTPEIEKALLQLMPTLTKKEYFQTLTRCIFFLPESPEKLKVLFQITKIAFEKPDLDANFAFMSTLIDGLKDTSFAKMLHMVDENNKEIEDAFTLGDPCFKKMVLQTLDMVEKFSLENNMSDALRLGNFIMSALENIEDSSMILKEENLSAICEVAALFLRKNMTEEEVQDLFQKLSSLLQKNANLDAAKLAYLLAEKRVSISQTIELIEFVEDYAPKLTQITKENFFSFLLTRINNTANRATFNPTKRLLALNLAECIVDFQSIFRLKDDEAVVQVALQTILWLKGEKTDPCYVYAHAKKTIETCQIPLEQTIQPVEVAILHPRGRVLVELNLSGLQKGLKILRTKRKTYAEFTQWIDEVNQARPENCPLLGPFVFKDLLNRFLLRLQSLSPRDFELEREVSLVSLYLTEEGYTTADLMAKPYGKEEDLVPALLEKLYAIAADILQQSNSLDPNHPEIVLSPQEDSMMARLHLIRDCKSGQEEGISVCYNSIQASNFDPNNEVQPEKEAVEEYLAQEVQKVLEEVALSPKTLKHLGVKDADLEQSVHQAQYIKGIIGEEGGLNYALQIDPYSDTISPELTTKSRDGIAKAFFYQLSKELAPSLLRDINANLFSGKLYDSLNMFFTNHKVDVRKVWKAEINGSVELTEFGAFMLLEKGGYIKANLTDYSHYLDLQNRLEDYTEEARILENKTPIPLEEIEKAKSHQESCEKAYKRAVQSKDEGKQEKKEAYEQAKKRYSKLVEQEKKDKENLQRMSLLKRLIAITEKDLSSLGKKLEERALQEEIPPPLIPNTQQLIEGNLPADIQKLGWDLEAIQKELQCAAEEEKEELKNKVEKAERKYLFACYLYELTQIS
jgi:hypothetical protein